MCMWRTGRSAAASGTWQGRGFDDGPRRGRAAAEGRWRGWTGLTGDGAGAGARPVGIVIMAVLHVHGPQGKPTWRWAGWSLDGPCRRPATRRIVGFLGGLDGWGVTRGVALARTGPRGKGEGRVFVGGEAGGAAPEAVVWPKVGRKQVSRVVERTKISGSDDLLVLLFFITCQEIGEALRQGEKSLTKTLAAAACCSRRRRDVGRPTQEVQAVGAAVTTTATPQGPRGAPPVKPPSRGHGMRCDVGRRRHSLFQSHQLIITLSLPSLQNVQNATRAINAVLSTAA